MVQRKKWKKEKQHDGFSLQLAEYDDDGGERKRAKEKKVGSMYNNQQDKYKTDSQ